MVIQGVDQVKRPASSVPIDYEALAAKCVAAGTAGFKTWETFDAEASYRAAHGKKQKTQEEKDAGESDEHDSEEDAEVAAERSAEEADMKIRHLLRNPPKELNQIGDYPSEGEFIVQWLCHLVYLWKEGLKDESSKVSEEKTFGDKKVLKRTEEWLRPLIHVLRQGGLSDTAFGHIKEIALRCQVSEYDVAQKSYVQMMIGNVKWHMDVQFGEARYNKGYNYRRVKADGGDRLFDDETTKNFCLAIKVSPGDHLYCKAGQVA